MIDVDQELDSKFISDIIVTKRNHLFKLPSRIDMQKKETEAAQDRKP